MKALLALDRWVGKVESFFLAASLIAMLLLTLYSVAYRNLVAPFVLKMQASEMSQVAPLTEAPAPAPAATPVAAAAPSAEAPSAGDLDDEPAAPAKAAAAPSTAPSAGDLDDEPAAPAKAVAAAPAAAANAPSAGDLDDEPPAPAKAAAAPSTAPSAGDLEDEPAAPAANAGAAPDPAPAVAPVVPAAAPPRTGEVPQDSTFLKFLKALNFAWIDKVTLHLLLWVGFFGAAIAAGKRKHIKIDALSRLLPAAVRERLQILLDLAAAIACFFLANAALKFMASEVASGGMFYGPVPGWVGIAIIPVGFGMLLWHFLLDAIFEVALWTGNKTPELLAWKEELQRAQEEVA